MQKMHEFILQNEIKFYNQSYNYNEAEILIKFVLQINIIICLLLKIQNILNLIKFFLNFARLNGTFYKYNLVCTLLNMKMNANYQFNDQDK